MGTCNCKIAKKRAVLNSQQSFFSFVFRTKKYPLNIRVTSHYLKLWYWHSNHTAGWAFSIQTRQAYSWCGSTFSVEQQRSMKNYFFCLFYFSLNQTYISSFWRTMSVVQINSNEEIKNQNTCKFIYQVNKLTEVWQNKNYKLPYCSP